MHLREALRHQTGPNDLLEGACHSAMTNWVSQANIRTVGDFPVPAERE